MTPLTQRSCFHQQWLLLRFCHHLKWNPSNLIVPSALSEEQKLRVCLRWLLENTHYFFVDHQQTSSFLLRMGYKRQIKLKLRLYLAPNLSQAFWLKSLFFLHWKQLRRASIEGMYFNCDLFKFWKSCHGLYGYHDNRRHVKLRFKSVLSFQW